MLIYEFYYTKYEPDLVLYTRNPQNKHLKPIFEYKIIF